MSEDRMLLEIAVRQAIAALERESDRAMLGLYFQLEDPADYEGVWPPTYASVAAYIGIKYGDGPLAESTIRYRMSQVLERWREAGVLLD